MKLRVKPVESRPHIFYFALTVIVFPLHALVDDWPRLIGAVAGGLALYYGSTWFLLDFEDKQFLRGLLKLEPAAAGGV